MSSSPLPPAFAAQLHLFVLRPLLAVSFVASLLTLGWWVAWRLVLVHVPLVQEIFGLRKKTVNLKPPTSHRFSRLYSSVKDRRRD